MADDSSSSGSEVHYVFYHYNPSMAAAVIFVVLFGVSAILHTYQIIRNRTWYFIPFVIGCLFETIGYIGRVLSAKEAPDFTKNPYIIQSLLLLLGPSLFTASIYMILARLIRLLEAESYSVIRTKWLTSLFVLGDVLSFFTQGGGGGILSTAKDKDDVKKGEMVIVGGLAIQIVFFSCFVVVTFIFHRRISAKPTRKSLSLPTPWRSLLYVLYLSSALILVRSVYRVIEYVMGSDGVLLSNEYYLYIFDGLLMAIVAVVFNYFHPSRVINRAKDLDRVASLEVMSEGYMMPDTSPRSYDPLRSNQRDASI